MPEVATPQPELPLQAPPKAQPSKAARFEIPDGADIVSLKNPVETPTAKPAPTPKPAAAAPEPNTAESATATPEGETPSDPAKAEEDTPEQAAKREERRRQNKLEKAYRQRAEAKARADFLEKQLAEAQARTAAPQQDAGAPRLEQFDFDQDKFAKALTEYTTKKAEKELQVKQQAEAGKQYQARLASEWENKVEKVEEKYDDYQSVVGEISPASPLAIAIMEAENGPDVAYYLGKNLKEAQRIAALPVLSQVREIGKLEQKLSAQPEKPKTPSKAPAPITPLAGTAPPNPDALNDPGMSDAEWIKRRQKKVHGR